MRPCDGGEEPEVLKGGSAASAQPSVAILSLSGPARSPGFRVRSGCGRTAILYRETRAAPGEVSMPALPAHERLLHPVDPPHEESAGSPRCRPPRSDDLREVEGPPHPRR